MHLHEALLMKTFDETGSHLPVRCGHRTRRWQRQKACSVHSL